MMGEPESALTAFGFNQLESIVYCELLRQSPATGYRLSQRVARAPANIYQALSALLQKGAILEETDSADASSYIPVPPDQLFASLRSSFSEKSNAALTLLGTVHRPPQQETLSQLRTAAQVMARARAMLNAARHRVMFDMVPPLYDLLREEMANAEARGVAIAGIAYRAEDATSTIPFKNEPPEAVFERWPGWGIIVVTDAAETLIAQVSPDMVQVLNAVYTDSSFLSSIMHGLLHSDIRLMGLKGEMPDSIPPSPLDALALGVVNYTAAGDPLQR